MDPATVAAWMWLDAAEDIAFGVDILLSAAAALARDLRLVDAPADGSGAFRGEPASTMDEKPAVAPGAEQGAGAGQLRRSAESAAAAVQQAAGARWRAHGSCARDPTRRHALLPDRCRPELCLAVNSQRRRLHGKLPDGQVAPFCAAYAAHAPVGFQQEDGAALSAHVAAVLSTGRAAAAEGEARGWGRLASLARHPAPEAPGGVAPGQARRVSWLKQLAEAADLRCGGRARSVSLNRTKSCDNSDLQPPPFSPRYQPANALELTCACCSQTSVRPTCLSIMALKISWAVAGPSQNMHQGCMLEKSTAGAIPRSSSTLRH